MFSEMDLIEHEKHCIQELGLPYSEIHLFLDQYAKKYRGFSHRRLLHHRLGIDFCIQEFGEDARHAATLHILDDFGFIPTNWKELEKHSFPLLEDEEEQEKDLAELYGKEKYEEIEGSWNNMFMKGKFQPRLFDFSIDYDIRV